MLFVLLAFLNLGHADSIYDYYQDRSATQWTLSDWLSTKKKSSLMDQWLSTNRSSKKWFDFQGGYAERSLEESLNNGTAIEKDYEGINVGMYFAFLGIEGDYFRNKEVHADENWSYSLNLRLLGSSQQSTHWKVYYGLQHEEDTSAEYDNNFWGSALNLYITPYFGLHGDYRSYIKDTNDAGTEREGFRSQYGVFLEVFFFRLYHTWQEEEFDLTDLSNTESTIERESREFGIMIFY